MCFGSRSARWPIGIFMTPTLVKLAPAPAGRIVGTLSQTQPVLQALWGWKPAA